MTLQTLVIVSLVIHLLNFSVPIWRLIFISAPNSKLEILVFITFLPIYHFRCSWFLFKITFFFFFNWDIFHPLQYAQSGVECVRSCAASTTDGSTPASPRSLEGPGFFLVLLPFSLKIPVVIPYSAGWLARNLFSSVCCYLYFAFILEGSSHWIKNGNLIVERMWAPIQVQLFVPL